MYQDQATFRSTSTTQRAKIVKKRYLKLCCVTRRKHKITKSQKDYEKGTVVSIRFFVKQSS